MERTVDVRENERALAIAELMRELEKGEELTLC
jgi:hypothetical protein